jgi:hypothetical protein
MANALRRLTRENIELRAIVGEFLDHEEAAAITSLWPHGDHPPGKPRLCKILAREIAAEWPADLRRIKRARRALGLPAWWDKR